MKVLIVGGGGREHALAWKLSQSFYAPELLIAPGNAGTSLLGSNMPIAPDDVNGLSSLVRNAQVDLTIVGPEAALAAGLVDRLQNEGFAVFGPTKDAARLESSKSFAKEIMVKSGVRTADAKIFDDYQTAKAFLHTLEFPTVVKADGLAAGKGVVVAGSSDEALKALEDMMVKRVFGTAGDRVLIEECLVGQEISVFAFSDGESLSRVVAAGDYKRIYDGDDGPNTGGMGAYSPPLLWTPDLADHVRNDVMAPVIRTMAREGCPFVGVLYAGLILTEEGPKVLEFNCRLGDPETQVVLPRLRNDLIDVIQAILSGTLVDLSLDWSSDSCVGVVLASGGYPGDYSIGLPITIMASKDPQSYLFHAGTAINGEVTSTAGGRVITAVGLGPTLLEAKDRAYKIAENVDFEGCYFRRDIAAF